MKILIVDDETNIQKTIALALKTMGHNAITAFNGKQALRKLGENRVDAIFLDLRLGDENGIEVFEEIRASGHDMPVIMFTAYSSIETAVEATRKGIFDYIQKPFVPEQIRQLLSKLEENLTLTNKVSDLESRLEATDQAITFDSRSPAMEAIYQVADRAAKSEANILLLGPSGAGKTVLSRRIHERSDRASGSFVMVHCPSLSKELLESELFGHVKGSFTGAVKDTWGKVEAASDGTLFLDEIGDLPLEIQAKLLRLIQEREYERVGETKTRTTNTRILAATNKDLQEEVNNGNFREDLFYRLNVITLQMPSLAERKDDLPQLIESYLAAFSRKLGRPKLAIEENARNALLAYDWPGNLRELNNAIERCAILCPQNTITISDLPLEIRQIPNEGENSQNAAGIPELAGSFSLQELEDAYIRRTLDSAESLESAASILGIDTATLYRKRKKLGLL